MGTGSDEPASESQKSGKSSAWLSAAITLSMILSGMIVVGFFSGEHK